MSVPLDLLETITDRVWLVGGAVRDELLERDSTDFDVALPGDAAPVARDLSRRAGAHAFALSDTFGAWRVVARDHAWQIDLMPIIGDSILEDLARRDLTINAIARDLRSGELLDPLGDARIWRRDGCGWPLLTHLRRIRFV